MPRIELSRVYCFVMSVLFICLLSTNNLRHNVCTMGDRDYKVLLRDAGVNNLVTLTVTFVLKITLLGFYAAG